MSRLTKHTKEFGYNLKGNITVRGDCKTYNMAIEKLAQYEDTGLAPDEIHKLNDFEQSQIATLLKEKAILLKEHFELKKERNYWEREAKKWGSELGEQKLERGK